MGPGKSCIIEISFCLRTYVKKCIPNSGALIQQLARLSDANIIITSILKTFTLISKEPRGLRVERAIDQFRCHVA